MKQALTTTLGVLLLAPLTSPAQAPSVRTGQGLPKPEEVVALRAEPARLTLRPGSTAALKLKVEILPGFHINSNQPLEEYLIATEVFLPAGAEFELAGATYPKAELKSFSFAAGEKLAVYEGMVEVAVRLRARPAIQPGTHALALGLRYQACNDEICLRPAERQLTLSVRVPQKPSPAPRRGS